MDFYQRMAKEIDERLFTDEFFQKIFHLYLREVQADGVDSEREFVEAVSVLSQVLDGPCAARLQEAQRLSLSCAKWLARYGFSKGTFAGYRRCFLPQFPPLDFYSFVFPHVMQMPGIACYPDYHQMRDEANAAFGAVRQSLGPQRTDFVANIEVAWQDRFLGILRHSFYLGFRYTLHSVSEISGQSSPLYLIADALKYEEVLFSIGAEEEDSIQ